MNKQIKIKDRAIPTDPKKLEEEMVLEAKRLVSKIPKSSKNADKRPAQSN